MQNSFLTLSQKSLHRLATKGLSRDTLLKELGKDFQTYLELMYAMGIEIVKENGKYFFSTKFLSIEDATFCVVDIETNGSKLEKHQIIEIAAQKIKNNKIIDRFETLVRCERINPAITEITGIAVEDTLLAPKLSTVLQDFRNFLGDSIFVAHDVKFDYEFISGSLQKFGYPPLMNRYLCSIDLAERTISSYRYGLKYLNDYLQLHPDATHHRAMSDVITTTNLFLKSLKKLPEDIKTVEELIAFSKEAKRLKRPEFDPLLKVEEKEAT